MPIVEDIRDVERIKEVVTNATGGRLQECELCRQQANDPSEARQIVANGKQPGLERGERNSSQQEWEGGESEQHNGNTVGCAVGCPSGSGREGDGGRRGNRPESSTILITAGFPCQPFSVAGKQLSQADDRYLWPQTIAVIKEVKPQWVLLENVTGIINLALDTVLSDLEGAGYATETLVIPACAVNAWHRRDRVWIVANQFSEGLEKWAKQELLEQCETVERDSLIANPRSTEPRGLPNKQRQENAAIGGGSQNVADTTNRGAQRSSTQCNVGGLENEVLRSCWNPDYWAVEPELGRVAHGVPHRVDRLKCLGNAIVPQVAYEIIKVIIGIDEGIPQNTYT
ncbi:DNA cytosine methyltransferase, partial [Candidatus Magnetobacterium casensis]|nr:DNA cytosine methyltransferase [Candidatus Magnetobacterium casensis]